MLKQGTAIISSAEFRNNISKYLKDIDKDQEPVFITVNGNGSHVIMHIDVYDELRKYRKYCLEHGISLESKNNREGGASLKREYYIDENSGLKCYDESGLTYIEEPKSGIFYPNIDRNLKSVYQNGEC